MKNATKIIIAIGAVILVVAVVLVVSLISGKKKEEDASTLAYSLQTLPSTTVGDTSHLIDIDEAIASEVSEYSETETVSETASTTLLPIFTNAPQTTVVYVYVETQTAETTKKSTTAPDEMQEYKYTVDSTTRTVTLTKYLGNSTSVIVPSKVGAYTVNKIGDGCFKDKSIKYVSIPESIEYIGASAFYGCKNLVQIGFSPASYLTSIGAHAFDSCEKLSSFTNFPTVKSIGSFAFQNCKSLKSLVLKDGTESIGEWCFANCTSLVALTIPKSVTVIGQQAFSGHNENLVVTCIEGSTADEVI
ncbi:MAG: leucine-rich repeat domain-containing protein, partial [Acutalibacteraceae bacterium]